MCGIVGYIGEDGCADIVERGLESLEYRGYDSAGVALVGRGQDLKTAKGEGTIDDVSIPDSEGVSRGIGHTRWSTHGEPTDRNAHPHTACADEVAVVHNGIITNHASLKRELSDHQFTSETDTEVVPHLIEEYYREGSSLLSTVHRVVDRLEGSFALAVAATHADELIVARQDSPLVVGHGERGTHVGSDPSAFVEFTDRVTYLQNGDVARLTSDGAEVYNEGKLVRRETGTLDWDAQAAEKAGHDHYTHKEIHEQPDALRRTLLGRFDTSRPRVELDLGLDRESLRELYRVDFVACGTSFHAALFAKHLFESLADVHVTATVASEYDTEGIRQPGHILTVCLTQSGETADTLTAIRKAGAAETPTLAITNTVGSTVTREVDDVIHIRAGPEIGVAATKTFVSQAAVVTLLAVHLGQVQSAFPAQRAATVLSHLGDLPEAVKTVIDRELQIERLAETYADAEAFFYIGRNLGIPVALEGALKMKEISYLHAEGFPAGELKHGPLALVTEETPVIALLTEGADPWETQNNVEEVRSRGAPTVGLTSLDDTELRLRHTLRVPNVGILEPLVANVALQLLAYHVADRRGRPIDKPRNLAKSVTVR